MMTRFFNKHSEYQELLTEYLDGRLDSAGDAALQTHVGLCSECASDLQEMSALKEVLRAEPMVEPPRSFALPLHAGMAAPQQVRESEQGGLPGFMRWAGNGSLAMLRSMQIATAAAALVLVALVGLDVSGVIGGQPQAGVMSFEAFEDQRLAGDQGGIMEHAPSPGTEGSAEGPEIALSGPPQVAADADAVVIAPVEPSRSYLELAQLALSGLTALLALGVVGFSWAMYRRPI